MLLVKLFLWPFSLLYGFVLVVRNWMYDLGLFRCYAIGVPVISVGSLTAGGTGKTPIVEYVVAEFMNQHKKVAVVSRGYKRASKGCVVVSDGHTILADATQGGDEPVQIARKHRSAVVVVDEDRVRGTRTAVDRFGSEVVVLDDGFQHRRLARDLDIVVIDVEWPPQREWLLPAGKRREPMAALRRAGALVFSRWTPESEAVKQYYRQRTSVPMFDARFVASTLVRLSDGSQLQRDSVRGQSCFVFCGIARPEVFEQTVKGLGVQVKGRRFFPDHYRYTLSDAERFLREATDLGVDFVLTTEKDAVRLVGVPMEHIVNRLPLYYVEIDTYISDRSSFSQLLVQTCG